MDVACAASPENVGMTVDAAPRAFPGGENSSSTSSKTVESVSANSKASRFFTLYMNNCSTCS